MIEFEPDGVKERVGRPSAFPDRRRFLMSKRLRWGVVAFVVLAVAIGTLAAVSSGSAGTRSGQEAKDRPRSTETTAPFTENQEYLFEVIRSRRTVRNFKETAVPKEHLLKILDMARCAPTSGNQQPWKFLVIQDRAKLNRLKGEAVRWYLAEYARLKNPPSEELDGLRSRMTATMERVLSAPIYVAVLTDAQSPNAQDNRHDGPLAVAMLMIAARALGYGTGFYTTYFPEARMRDFLGFPERYRLVCFTPIGIPVEWPAAPPKKPLEEFVVYEKF
jgi:nitroreductase